MVLGIDFWTILTRTWVGLGSQDGLMLAPKSHKNRPRPIPGRRLGAIMRPDPLQASILIGFGGPESAQTPSRPRFWSIFNLFSIDFWLIFDWFSIDFWWIFWLPFWSIWDRMLAKENWIHALSTIRLQCWGGCAPLLRGSTVAGTRLCRAEYIYIYIYIYIQREREIY